jgi:hypothetical protein
MINVAAYDIVGVHIQRYAEIAVLSPIALIFVSFIHSFIHSFRGAGLILSSQAQTGQNREGT